MAAHAGPLAATDARSVRRRLAGDTRVRIAIVVLTLLALSAAFASQISPYDPKEHLGITTLNGKPPSLAHPFGTDPFSRDVFSRLIHGTRVSLVIAFGAVALATTLGTVLGAIAGYVGGVVDSVIMRVVDAALAIPPLLLLIVVIALWGSIGIVPLALLIGNVQWFGTSRLVRAETVALRDTDFVVAARALGVPGPVILWRHVLPNAVGPAIVGAALAVGNIILLEAGLSYLGIGVPQPTPSWGNIIQDGSERVSDLWWLTLFPGLAILVTVFACNALGDALREALDPRQLQASPLEDTLHHSA